MKATIKAPNGVTIELDDATAEEVERMLEAAGRGAREWSPIKELAPVPTLPIDPRIGSPLPRYPWTLNPYETQPYQPDTTTWPTVAPLITWTSSEVEVMS